MVKSNRSPKTQERIMLLAYYAVLISFLVASFFPQYRLWGVNWWSYFPKWIPFMLFAVGAVAPFVTRLVFKHEKAESGERWASAKGDGKYFAIVLSLIVVFGLAFYLLRARTHFLGDGYTLIALLSSGNPLIEKYRQIGESLVHMWLYSAIGGESERDAVVTYQIVSITAGVAFVITVALFSMLVFERISERLLFLLGLVSGGYMLLYFGYVENYSIFALSIAVYCLSGLLVLKEKVPKWVMLPLWILTVFFHLFGVILIPATAYLLVKNSVPEKILTRQGRSMKILICLVVMVLLFSVFFYMYTTDYFFRLSLVPLLEHQLTQEEYTLFSGKHLTDMLNLAMVLVPALPMFIAVFMWLPLRSIFRRIEYQWLGIVVSSTLGAAFIFDPKLGMPRDWDLFSFFGIPLAVLFYYTLLDNRKRIQGYATISLMAVSLGFLVLIPRAVSLVLPQVAIPHFRNYLALDKVKNRNSWILLVNHYESVGDTTMANRALFQWKSSFPEELMLARANELYFKEKRLKETVALLYKILDINPTYTDVYGFLGFCYLDLHQYDSAITLLKLANALSPYRANNINNLGQAYFYKGEYKKAEKALLQAIRLDSTMLGTLYNLARLYQSLNQMEKYHYYLNKMASRTDAPMEAIGELGDYYLGRGEYEKAAEAYRRALQKGLDSLYVKGLIEKYPQLKDLLK